VFLNPGGLPAPLRLEDLKRPHRSVPRNRKVAEMFFYAGWIEQWGRGIQKMLDECAAAGLPEPDTSTGSAQALRRVRGPI
jgi:ATP-dependent DNA helicase RecG